MSGMKSVGGKLADVGVGFAKFGVAAGAAMVGVAGAATKMAADFQDKMADVDTLLGPNSAERLKELGKDVKRISVLVGKDLDDIAGGMYQVVSAFGEGADNAKQLEIAAKAAKAGLATTTDSVNMLSAVTKGYGDVSAEAVQKAADLAFVTVKLGQTTFPELAASMGKAVPLAATLKVKQEELFGAMATLTGVTGNTAEVSTQLRATLQALINPSSDMAKKLSQLGFANGKAMIESLGLQGSLNLLQQATGGNTSELAKMFGSVEALNAVLALTGAQSKDYTDKTKAMYEATGAADEAFKKKKDTINSMLASLKQMGSVMMVELGEKFLPVLMKVGQWIIDNMPLIQAVMEAAFNAVGVVVNWLGGVFGWFLDNVLRPFVAAWNGDAEAMQGPIGRFATFVKGIWEAIAGYFSNWRENIWKPFINGWNGGNTEMGTTAERIWGLIGSIMRKAWSIIQGVGELIVMYWREFGDDVMQIAGIVWETVLRVIDGALGIIDGIIKFFVALFKGDWQGMWDAVVQIWTNLWDTVVAIVTGIQTVLEVALMALYGAISKWFLNLVDDVSKWATDMWAGFKTTVEGAWNLLVLAFEMLKAELVGWFIGLAVQAIGWGADMMRGFWDGITGWFKRIYDGISEFANNVAGKVKGALGIQSPSKVFREIGADIGAGLALGIEGTEAMVNRALAGITPADVSLGAVESVGRGGGLDDIGARQTQAGPVTFPITLDGKVIAEYVWDEVTRTLRQTNRAMGTT